MGRPKGGKNRKWTKEDRMRVVKRYLDEHIGTGTLAKIENVPRGTLRKWITKYLKSGEEALECKKKVGNRFSALHTSKSLTLEERQRLIIEKQQIEIERLKKGYIVKGVGAGKEYVTLRDANTK